MTDHLLPNARENDTKSKKAIQNDHYYVKQCVNTSFNMSVRHSSLHLTVVADKQVSRSANVTILDALMFITLPRRDLIHLTVPGSIHL